MSDLDYSDYSTSTYGSSDPLMTDPLAINPLDPPLPISTRTSTRSGRAAKLLGKAKSGLDKFITLGDRIRASDNIWLKIALVSLTLVGLFGFGDYNPPRFIKYLTTEAPFLKVFSQWVLLVILAYQGLGGQDVWLSVISTYIFFFFFELIKVIENLAWKQTDEEKEESTEFRDKMIAFILATVIVIIYYLIRRYSGKSKTL